MPTLATILEAQKVPPAVWVIVDTGSSDETVAVAKNLATARSWISVLEAPATGAPARGATIVRAFHVGLAAVPEACSVIAKLDADITMEPDYFERLLAEFAAHADLGIASGTAYERSERGMWRQRHGTGPAVWGAARAYRRACLDDVLPLEERMGWDTIDLITALVRGWKTEVLFDLPFFHHRSEGARDASRWSHWSKQGRAAHYLGYRPSYVLMRAAFRVLRDPAAVGVVVGYLAAARTRAPRCGNPSVVDYVRDQQRLRRLPLRGREALRRRAQISPEPGPTESRAPV